MSFTLHSQIHLIKSFKLFSIVSLDYLYNKYLDFKYNVPKRQLAGYVNFLTAQHWVKKQNQACLLTWFIIYVTTYDRFSLFWNMQRFNGMLFLIINDYVLIWHAKYQNDFTWTTFHAYNKSNW